MKRLLSGTSVSKKVASVASALEYVILGHDSDEQGTKRRKLLLFNGALPSHDPKFYAQLVDLEPMRRS